MDLKRRQFLKRSAVFAGVNFLPAGLWANSPNSRFCTAHIGVGGMGAGDLKQVASHPEVQVVGLVDVDRRFLEKEGHPDAQRFSDYREMFAALGDKVDGVVISTPDHTHYPATLMAMNAGKAVYCQKPLTHSIEQAYELSALAEQKQLVTQMGIQCHASTAYRMTVNFLQQGIIGKVSRVYVWSHKQWGDDAPNFEGSDPVPEYLDWPRWLGTAKPRPYLNGKYHPGQWRKCLDFGCGTLGDMGVHILDTPLTALKLGAPKSVKASCRAPNGLTFPTKSIVEYQYEGTEYTNGPLQLTWFDGAHAPSVTASDNPDLQLDEGKELPKQGAMFIGEDGNRLLLPHLAAPQPLPRDLLGNVQKPDLAPINHYHEWIDAAMGKGRCSAAFDYAADLTATVLLGVSGYQFPGKTITWTPAATNEGAGS